jgi:4'-phosphopantetheinyl transferase EntD
LPGVIRQADGVVPREVVLIGAMTCAGGALHPVEKDGIGEVGAGRLREFAVGRACARRGLGLLGLEVRPVGVGEHREPVWPDGVVGSISHHGGVCLAAVARADEFVGVGIDIANVGGLPQGTRDLVLTAGEKKSLEEEDEMIAFSAKESALKFWWPLGRRVRDPREIEIEIDREAGSFEARPRGGDGDRERGRFAQTGRFVVTGVSRRRDS